MPNIPEIRFNGYTDAWEQRKLSECAGFRRGSFPQPYGNKDWYDGEGAQPFVQVADVSSDMKLVDDTKQKISKLAQPMSVFAEKGSVLVTLQGSIGRVAITQYGAYVDRTVLIFDKYNDDINKKFWAYIIKEKFVEEARKAPGGTIKTITKEALSDFDLMLPCYEEQSKLAEFLLNLDNLITLHQRKCDEIKELKKYMLQNMFPQKGEKVPRIRFNGYTDDWEQRKLGELGSLKNGMNFSKDAMGHGYAFVNLQNIFENNVVDGKSLGLAEASEKQLLEYSLQIGDVLFVRSSVKLEGVGEAALVAEPLEHTTYSGFIIRFRDEYGLNNDFKKFVFATKKVRNQIMSQATNSANKNINQSVLENLTLEIPSKDEQKQIGEYFSTLDNLITLHQRKCDELKELKKYMLQKMFPKEK